MFGLTEAELTSFRILSVADGPASFNAQMHELGRRVVSIDPVYVFSPEQIRQRVHETWPLMLQTVTDYADTFVWKTIRSPGDLKERRLAAMERFVADFPTGAADGRYLAASLPELPFGDDSFDLALCSHFLFLYSDQLNFDFHLASIIESCRVARELRIFPLLKHGNTRSQHLHPIIDRLHSLDYDAVIQQVDYEFQKGGNQMLIVRRRL